VVRMRLLLNEPAARGGCARVVPEKVVSSARGGFSSPNESRAEARGLGWGRGCRSLRSGRAGRAGRSGPPSGMVYQKNTENGVRYCAAYSIIAYQQLPRSCLLGVPDRTFVLALHEQG